MPTDLERRQALWADISTRLQTMREPLFDLARQIHGFAEEAGEERRSAAVLEDFLAENGFSVERGFGSQPTAFRAVWGTAGPVIGFLAEYDALPGLDQGAGSTYCGTGTSGHGCGHNLLGAGSVAAAVALQAALMQAQISATLVVYGTPAEETLYGKTRMKEEGAFAEAEAILTWHPGTKNHCGEWSHKAMTSVVYRFHGRTAHASVCPEEGRSGLDACELMNVGVNYLREHVPSHVRMHYSYCSPQGKPNIVPEEGALWYFVRANTRIVCDQVLARVTAVAAGAAMMTGTAMTHASLSQTAETRINTVLSAAAYKNMVRIGAPEYSAEDLKLVTALASESGVAELRPIITQQIMPPDGTVKEEPGSTDFSAVSQTVPAVELNVACFAEGTPGHHWTVTAQARTQAACKGMLFAAEVLASTALDLIIDRDLRISARAEFEQRA